MAMTAEQIANKLSKYPELLNRVERFLDIIDNKDGRTTLADDAEDCVIEEMRGLGKEILGKWGEDEEKRRNQLILESGVVVRKKTKKNSTSIRYTGKLV